MNHQEVRPRREQGMALIITLVFMLILTIISFSGLQSGITQSRMASNQQDYNAAFQNAEAALRAGEEDVKDADILDLPTSQGACQCSPVGASDNFCVNKIRDLSPIIDANGERLRILYCVRAMGIGNSSSSRVMLESRFVKIEGI
ncbi:hypothetical protein HLB35_03665 [Halomonas sp. TBZ9]|uniref:Type 4 fimbrial biogenesis protein PilX N-terminal domain-containing protein n=1 Tax=Vreelandella azerica TaxID=2732867 RepID=A0A7Y3XA98_9GAMM|nr:PilX N-terminal domain-containing pilus assembly protein [Halomonas azerica]NOG31081.1 hypothetical protein [Halomonas azerica]